MHVEFGGDEVRRLIREIVDEVLSSIDWPKDRIALDEAEAASACGVARHVLRDLRLAGKIKAKKLGRKIIYTRDDILRGLRERR